tara:strand:+ start:42 stop:1019 length:978 start_codon:yes stop_codon:yes gene_type:complete
MSLGNLLSSLAPVAAGFMTGGSSFAFAPLLAGAATGAGIAALRDEDPLMGAVTGGIGGYGGGQLGTAAQNVTKAGLGSYSAGPVQGMGSSLAQNVSQVPNVGAMEAAKTLVNNPGGVISNLGGGDMTKGAIKAGAVGLPAVAGAMVPDMPKTTGEMNQMKYDPNRRLNLNQSTGLRLLAQGGYMEDRDSRDYTDDEVDYIRYGSPLGVMSLLKEYEQRLLDSESDYDREKNIELIMKNMQKGGYLDEGPGDGMSDEIMGDIDGTQPVRLSEGEFVVPADVVSHLGNGDSDSGAEQLYGMMDRIRQARTGTTKQGKEIEPEGLMPA